MLAASLTGLALSALLVILVDRTSGDDVFSREIGKIVQSVYEVPRRNFLIASAFSGILFGAGFVLTILERRVQPVGDEAEDTFHWDDQLAPAYASNEPDQMLIGDAGDFPDEAVSPAPPR